METRSLDMKGSAWLALFLVLFAAFCVWLQPKGLYVIDEGVLALATHELVDNDGSRRLDNDFVIEDRQAYRPTSVKVVNSEWLSPQYPPLFSNLAAPFYLIAGVDGLFYLNNTAFLVNLLLVYLIGRRLSLDHRWSLVAVYIYGFCSFALDQAFSAWTHTVAVTGVIAGHYAMIRALQAEQLRPRLLAAFAAGLAAGLAVGVRLEMVLAFPIFATIFFFARPIRWSALVALVLGFAGPMLWIALINCDRFDYCNPLAYGPSSATGGVLDLNYYLPILGAGVLGLAMIWLAARPVAAPYRKQVLIAAPALVLVGGGLAWLVEPKLIERTLIGIRTIMLDVPAYDVSDRTPTETASGDVIYRIWNAVLASASGQMMFYDQYKKALLQNLPWLPLALPALIPSVGGRTRWPFVAALLLLPVAAIAMFGFANWHGGIGPNMRYLSVVAPLAAVPAAISLQWLFSKYEGDREMWQRCKHAVFAGLGIMSVVLLSARWPLIWKELVLLTVPLVLSALLLVALIWAWRRGGVGAARLLVGTTLAWGLTIGMFKDYGNIFFYRLSGQIAANSISKAVEPDAVIIMVSAQGYFLRTVAPAMAQHDAVLIQPEKPGAKGFEAVLERYEDSERPLFLAMPEEVITMYQERGALNGWEHELVGEQPKIWRLRAVEADQPQ